MGGLGKRLPWTAVLVLIGALSVSSLPPFNGFVSEWFTFQGLFTGSQSSVYTLRVLLPMAAVALGIASGLAVMVYIKMYGSIFSGPPRTAIAAEANEAPVIIRFSLGLLGLGCLVLGIASPLIVPWLAEISASIAHAPALPVAQGWTIFPGDSVQAILSPPVLLLLLAGLFIVPLAIGAVLGGYRPGRRANVDPWTCGYGYKPVMAVTASNYTQPVKVTFFPFYWVRTLVTTPYQVARSAADTVLTWIRRVESVVEKAVTEPAIRFVQLSGQWIQSLQMGDIRVYCFYIIITLSILLIVIFGRSGL